MRHNSGLKHSFLFMQLQFPSLNYSDLSKPLQCELIARHHSRLISNKILKNRYFWKNHKNYRLKNLVSPVAKNNVTILSSTHCSAPSAWPLQSNIIGFSQFWRKLLIFRTRNIYKIERPFIKKYLRF